MQITHTNAELICRSVNAYHKISTFPLSLLVLVLVLVLVFALVLVAKLDAFARRWVYNVLLIRATGSIAVV